MAAEAETNQSRFLNPWLLHLQKLGLELKCPLCLNLYSNPILLPCNHIFCSSCIPESDLFGLGCLLCKLPYAKQDLREVPFVENVVNIYRCLDGSFSKHMVNSGSTRVLEQHMHSTKPNFPEQLSKKTIDSHSGNLTSENYSIQPMGTKRVHASNNASVLAMMEKADKHVIDRNIGHSATYDSNLSSNTHSHHGVPTLHEHEAVDFEMNQTDLSPDSPPSSGVSKGVENDGHDLGSSDNMGAVKSVPENSAKRNIHDFSQLNEVPDACHKKQKQLHQDLPKKHHGHSTSTGADMKFRSGNIGGDQSAVEFDSTSLVNFTCAFCRSWKITEGSGPMHHFLHGNQVFGSDVGRSSVIHVHKSCIDWAPQIFYESDTVVKNIEIELARASKLKCTSCGLKGAALGCYASSCRRTYHVPCAYEISKCRWDSDGFLMLCPSHSSQKFPSERTKKSALKKCTASAQNFVGTQKDVEESNIPASASFWASSPSGPESWVLCGSALSADEKLMLVKFAKLCGATVTKAWNPNVTHVIAATDANGASSRTLKVLMAILNGKWILNTDWVKACMQSKGPVDEEPYEISLDNHGYTNGPKTGRLRALDNAPQLFSSLKFLFTGEFVPSYKSDIENLIRAAGGTILESKEQLKQPGGEQSTSSSIVIYNSDATMNTEDVGPISRAREEAERLASETESEFIPHTWILDSISSCKLQPFSQR